jgi:ParB/RepB/Spo0J family partition protein
MSHVQMIALKALTPSPLNARRIDKKIAIDELAASILAHGLLQGLSVVEVGGGKYQVSAGGRRLAALKLLLKRKAITGDFEVPCQVVPADLAEEASLAENVQRVAMHPLDEVEAFGRLASEGQTEEAIASRFGASVRHVRQRLALSALSPTLKDAFRKGELGLDAARAFCLVPDHDRQEAVFAIMPKPVSNAYAVRSYLTQGAVRASDRLAKFVGLEAYEAAGGIVRRDLFEEDLVFLDSPDVLNALATAELEELRAPLLAEGWGWVNINIGSGRGDAGSMHRIRPEWHTPTQEQIDAANTLSTKAASLEQALEVDPTNEALTDELAQVRGQLTDLSDSLRYFDPEKQALAGCVISIDFEGHVDTIIGIIAKGDQKKIARIDARRVADNAKADEARRREKEALEAIAVATVDGDDNGDTTRHPIHRPNGDGTTAIIIDPAAGTVTVAGRPMGETDTSADQNDEDDTASGNRPEPEAPLSNIPAFEPPPWNEDPPAPDYETDFTQKMMQDLTSARTRVLRNALSGDVDAALALAVYGLGAHQIARTGPIGLSVHAFGSFVYADQDALIERREILIAGCTNTEPEWFAWCMAQSREMLLEVQAILIASALDLSHSATTPPHSSNNCTRKQAIAGALAARLQINMASHWSPNIDFFMGLTKAQIIDIIQSAPVNTDNTDTRGKAVFAKHLASQKKDDLAVIATQALEGAGWLPDVLVTAALVSVAAGDVATDADAEPRFEVTDMGLEALGSAEAVAPDMDMAGVAAE